MPVAIVLVLVVGVMAAIMLERQGAERLIVGRRMLWYQEHHSRLGIQESVELWLGQLPSGADLGEYLGEGGHFLDLSMSDGTKAAVFVAERQSTILGDPSAAPPELREDAQLVLDAVQARYGEAGPPGGYRYFGPPSLSSSGTPDELLLVVALAVTGDERVASALVRTLAEDREANGGRSSERAVADACESVQVEPSLRAQLIRLIVARPSLYYATVELRSSNYGPPLARYGGYFTPVIPRTGSDVWSTRSAFLSWENLGVE